MKQLASNITDLEAIVQQKTNNLRMVEEGKKSCRHFFVASLSSHGWLTLLSGASVTAKGPGKPASAKRYGERRLCGVLDTMGADAGLVTSHTCSLAQHQRRDGLGDSAGQQNMFDWACTVP